MKAAIFNEPGLENIRTSDIAVPEVKEYDVLVKVVLAGVNPVDSYVIRGTRTATPLPHIPGAEFAGVIEEVGAEVDSVKKGDRVTVYPRIFDEVCDQCLAGQEMLCRNGGIVGVKSNGGLCRVCCYTFEEHV
jgi:D-arabinose 1-dehydrogenase-like Zn-dependent alcohol dehydrogenase